MASDTRFGPSSLLSAFLLGFCVAVSSCSRAVVSGFEDSPDSKYRMGISIAGAYGHAFSDNTYKTVNIAIYTNGSFETALLEQTYRIKGAQIHVDSIWDTNGNVAVVICDYGVGVSFYGLAKYAPSNRVIRTIAYSFEHKSGRFAEKGQKEIKD